MNIQLRILFAVICISTFFSCDSKLDNTNNEGAEKNNMNKNVEEQQALFQLVDAEHSNVDFANTITETLDLNIINYHYFYNGGGVAIGDINNDGLVDLFFTANQLKDKLYINKGNLKFEDASQLLPPQNEISWSTGVTMADVNADGWLDIYVSKSGNLDRENRRNVLYINQEGKGFTEEANAYGIDDPAYSTQAAFFDYDKDGDLDMFLLNHEIKDITNYNKDMRAFGRDPYVGDKLYKNEGGKFVDVSKQAGIISNPYGFGLGVAIGDLNNDGWPDIYVSNDFLENDYLYYNDTKGGFRESISSSTKHISNYGMGVDISDINNDGMQDVLVVDMVAKDNFRQKTNMSGMNPERFWQCIDFGFHFQYMFNTLQLNRGGERFSEVGQMAGISNTDWSWASLMADFDGDGKKDILISNGLRKDARNNDFAKEYVLFAEQMPKYKGKEPKTILQDQLQNMPSQRVPNYIFQNRGNIQFEDQSKAWGIDELSFSTGAAYADLDNDGDLDIVMNNVDDKAFIFENKNNTNNKNNYINIALKGNKSNPNGIGAKIVIETKSDKQTQEVYTTRGFQSAVPPIAYFGIGQLDQIEKIEVIWPDGKTNVINQASINQLMTINYSDAQTASESKVNVSKSFVDITNSLGIDYTHQENYYDDYKDQVLLPYKLSTLGPAIAVGDINNDGLEDMVIGGANGFSATIYVQTANGKFKTQTSKIFDQHKNYEDIDALLIDVDGDNDLDLYMASGGYEFDIASLLLQDRIYLNDGKGNFSYSENSLPIFPISTSNVKACDFDKDGDLDLFVGARLIPKKYPLSPSSYLLINENGKYRDATEEIAVKFKDMGMVTDAEWMDVDGDQLEDLVIVGEWMPISVFKNTKTKLELMDARTNGLNQTEGWWFSVQKIDFDQDGDLDFVAGNLGLNYKYKATKENPFKVFGADFDHNQSVDIVLSYAQNGEYYPVRGRECSSQQMPFIKQKFPNYNSFANANVYDILGRDNIKESVEKNAYTFATTLFENRDGEFISKPLDVMAQLSSVNDIIVEDLNKDGNMDMILGGNLYGAEVETQRNDASYGLILLGDGSSNFKTLAAPQTSFFGEGDVKKMIPIKITKQYTAYIIVQNSGPLKVFRYQNQSNEL